MEEVVCQSLDQVSRATVDLPRRSSALPNPCSARPQQWLRPLFYCGFHTPSFRHWWANCPRFNDDRATAASCSKLSPFPHVFWNLAPRCTSKSGWITYAASTDADARAHFAIAAAQVALAVMDATEALMDLDVSGAASPNS
ncbi:unnamed protein product [Polarella glacialis]|uniref:Uncharacterized protein n=1 Tax=Polarella glacialis TaxID=89957 RepID=A0A813GPN4_POLGL|nr:unnamed protein product [Polarella glacialis]